MTAAGATDFDIATLRARRTNKWHKFPPDVLPAWVADMDFGVAPSITAALTRLTQNQEYGYAAREGVLAEAFVRRMERRFGWRIDKRITPRFMRYERADLCIGIVLVIVGAVAMMALTAATFAGRPEFGNFQDAGAVAAGLGKYVGHVAGIFFAVALIDASVIGAMAVSLSTAYAIGDVLSLRHSLHRKPKEAKAFYAVYGGLVALAAALVLTPGTPLGLLTNTVQALAGVLLPSATVFLLLLCNDEAVLGPWMNGRSLNVFTGGVIAVLVMLSVTLTASVLFPDMGEKTLLALLGGGTVFTVAISAVLLILQREDRRVWLDAFGRMTWRMPPLDQLPPALLTPLTRIWLSVLRGYLIVAGGLILWRIVELAVSAS